MSEDEIIEIDKEVKKNREEVYFFVKKLPLNCKRKAKRLLAYGIFIFQAGQPLVPCAYHVVMPLPGVNNRLSPMYQVRLLNTKNYYPKIAPTIISKPNKMVLTNKQIEDINIIGYKLKSNQISLDKAVLELRGGGFYDWAAVILMLYMLKSQQADGFKGVPLPHKDPVGWANNKYNRNVGHGHSGSRPITSLKMKKPASMSQQEYSGMPKSEKRKLPDPLGRYRSINVDGYPELNLRFNQVEFKTPKHGKDHGLPLGTNDKTPKTEANAIALRDSLVDMANRENIVWYTNGQYQGGTDRGCDCVNLFDPDTNVIAVYEKHPDGSNLFLTTCTLTERESGHLKSTNGNFVTEKTLDEQN